MPTYSHERTKDTLRRISAAYKGGRISSGLKRRAKDALWSTANRLEHRPRVKRFVLWCLGLIPPLRWRLSVMLHVSSHRTLHLGAAGSIDLSPAAQNVFLRLTRRRAPRESGANRR